MEGAYLENSINYISIHKMLIKLLKNPYFSHYYDKSPKNLNEIENMVKKVKNYMENSIKIKVPLKVDINKGQSWSDAH